MVRPRTLDTAVEVCFDSSVMAKAKKEIGPFQGFPEETFAFLDGLKKNNDKKFFDANRDRYEQYIVAPSKAFVVAMGELLNAQISPDIVALPKAGASMGRINRDIRFSKDKTPYNAHLHFTFWDGPDKKTSPGFAMWLDSAGVGLGVGMRGFDKLLLERWRSKVLDDQSGASLDKAIRAVEKAGAKLSEPHYKKVPRGLPTDHPRADLLRYNTFHAMIKADVPKVVSSKRFAKWCTDRFQKLAPLDCWLVEHLL